MTAAERFWLSPPNNEHNLRVVETPEVESGDIDLSNIDTRLKRHEKTVEIVDLGVVQSLWCSLMSLRQQIDHSVADESVAGGEGRGIVFRKIDSSRYDRQEDALRARMSDDLADELTTGRIVLLHDTKRNSEFINFSHLEKDEVVTSSIRIDRDHEDVVRVVSCTKQTGSEIAQITIDTVSREQPFATLTNYRPASGKLKLFSADGELSPHAVAKDIGRMIHAIRSQEIPANILEALREVSRQAQEKEESIRQEFVEKAALVDEFSQIDGKVAASLRVMDNFRPYLELHQDEQAEALKAIDNLKARKAVLAEEIDELLQPTGELEAVTSISVGNEVASSQEKRRWRLRMKYVGGRFLRFS